MINAYKNLVGNPEGKKPREKPKCRWEDNISMEVREIRWKVVDWIYLTEDRDSGGLL
jgi:hypothetical protein